jgi:hypothetical protein
VFLLVKLKNMFWFAGLHFARAISNQIILSLHSSTLSVLSFCQITLKRTPFPVSPKAKKRNFAFAVESNFVKILQKIVFAKVITYTVCTYILCSYIPDEK